MKVYDIQTHTLSRLSLLYILKHNAFEEQVWPHFKASFLQINCHHMIIIYTATNPD